MGYYTAHIRALMPCASIKGHLWAVCGFTAFAAHACSAAPTHRHPARVGDQLVCLVYMQWCIGACGGTGALVHPGRCSSLYEDGLPYDDSSTGKARWKSNHAVVHALRVRQGSQPIFFFPWRAISQLFCAGVQIDMQRLHGMCS